MASISQTGFIPRLKTAVLEKDVVLYNGTGTNNALKFTLVDESAVAVNLTGMTLKMVITKQSDGTSILAAQSATITDAANGQFQFAMGSVALGTTLEDGAVLTIYNDASGTKVVQAQVLVDIVSARTL